MSLFAEGWGLAVAYTRGPAVIYDRLMSALVTVDGDGIAVVEAPFQGVPAGPDILVGKEGARGLVGGWPEGAVLRPGQWTYHPEIYRRTAGTWRAEQLAFDGEARRGEPVAGPDGGPLFMSEGRGKSGSTRLLSFGRSSGQRRVIGTTGMLEPQQIAALPDGRVAVLGYDVSLVWSVERWGADGAGPDTFEVPGTRSSAIGAPDARRRDVTNQQLTMCLARDGTLHVVRHDSGPGSDTFTLLALRGGRWEAKDVPVRRTGGLASSCAVGGDGSVWFGIENGAALYRLSPAGVVEPVAYPPLPARTERLRLARAAENGWIVRGTVEPVPLPEQRPGRFRAKDIIAADDGSVWIPGERTEDVRSIVGDDVPGHGLTWGVVLRVGPPLPGTPLDWTRLAPDPVRPRLAAYSSVRGPEIWVRPKAGPTCPTVFVAIDALPGAAPADVDFPHVRAAVKGRRDLDGTRFVEARVDRRRVLGALVPTYETGRRLLELLKGGISSNGAELSCGKPDVVRVIPMGIDGE